MMSSDILSFTSRLCFYSQVSAFIPILKGADVQGSVEMEAIFFIAACVAQCFGCVNQAGSITTIVFLLLLNNICTFPILPPLLSR